MTLLKLLWGPDNPNTRILALWIPDIIIIRLKKLINLKRKGNFAIFTKNIKTIRRYRVMFFQKHLRWCTTEGLWTDTTDCYQKTTRKLSVSNLKSKYLSSKELWLKIDENSSAEGLISKQMSNHMHMCVSGGKKCLLFGTFGVLYFLVTPVLRFVLLPYCRRILYFCIWEYNHSN